MGRELLRPISTYSILQGGSTGVWDAKIKMSLLLVFFWNLEQTEGKEGRLSRAGPFRRRKPLLGAVRQLI